MLGNGVAQASLKLPGATIPCGPLPVDVTLVPVTYFGATVQFLHVSGLRLLHRILRTFALGTEPPRGSTRLCILDAF